MIPEVSIIGCFWIATGVMDMRRKKVELSGGAL